MPYTGYDPQEMGGPIDNTGGGLDPSYAWALAPGGRFQGDEWAYLEYLAALDPSSDRYDAQGHGPLDGHPEYHVPDWLKNNLGKIGKLLALHEKNVQEGGGMNPGNPLEHGGNSLMSGPGADYGPLSGPTRGLLDQEGHFWDGADHRPEGTSENGPAPSGGHHGGGGGYNGPVGPMQPAQPNYHPSFLGWQPNNQGAPQFTGAANGMPPVPAAGPSGPTPPPGGFQGKWRGPNRGGAASPSSGGSGASGGTSGAAGGTGTGGTYTVEDAARELGLSPEELAGLGIGIAASGKGKGPRVKQDFGAEGYTGADVNMMGANMPGWLRDPTSSVHDTAGMPNPTAPTRLQGEGTDDYINRLSDMGFGAHDISTMIGAGGGAMQGYGMGGTVVRGPEGYQFGDFADQYAPGEHYDIGPNGARTYFQHDLPEGQQGPPAPNSQQALSDSMRDFLNSGGGGGGRDESAAGLWNQFMGAFI